MDKRPLLSICIPTYNRADILDKTINFIIQDPDFDDEVELVISDNCSVDDTETVCEKYTKKYSNVRFFKNRENIKDRNFLTVLKEGNGLYRKLLNDYTYYKIGELRLIKENIRKYKNEPYTALFFYETLKDLDTNQRYIELNSVDHLISIVHNKITYNCNFGCFEWYIKELEQFQGESNLQLLVMLWTLYIVDISKKTILYNIPGYNFVPLHKNSRTSYNFFTPHVVNYYGIIRRYQNKGEISKKTIRNDKIELLKDFVGYKIVEYLIYKKTCPFNLEGSWRILFKEFGTTPYFYRLIFNNYIDKYRSKFRIRTRIRNLLVKFS